MRTLSEEIRHHSFRGVCIYEIKHFNFYLSIQLSKNVTKLEKNVFYQKQLIVFKNFIGFFFFCYKFLKKVILKILKGPRPKITLMMSAKLVVSLI